MVCIRTKTESKIPIIKQIIKPLIRVDQLIVEASEI